MAFTAATVDSDQVQLKIFSAPQKDIPNSPLALLLVVKETSSVSKCGARNKEVDKVPP